MLSNVAKNNMFISKRYVCNSISQLNELLLLLCSIHITQEMNEIRVERNSNSIVTLLNLKIFPIDYSALILYDRGPTQMWKH